MCSLSLSLLSDYDRPPLSSRLIDKFPIIPIILGCFCDFGCVWMMISAGVLLLRHLEVELRGKVEPWGEGTSIEVGSHRSTGL